MGMSVARGQPIDSADLGTLWGIVNTHWPDGWGETPGPPSGSRGDWLTELNQIRQRMREYIVESDPQVMLMGPQYGLVSGPWACSRAQGMLGNASFAAPYYVWEDDGSPLELSAVAEIPASIINEDPWDEYGQSSTATHVVRVGGNSGGFISGDMVGSWAITTYPFTTDDEAATWPPAYEGSCDIPGAVFSVDDFTYSIVLTIPTETSCSPGTYTIHLAMTGANRIRNNPNPLAFGGLRFRVANSSKVTGVAGISDPYPLSKLEAPDMGDTDFGLWAEVWYSPNDAHPDGYRGVIGQSQYWEVSADKRGLWFARTAPIHHVAWADVDEMPPNMPFRGYVYTPDVTPPVQTKAAPPESTDVINQVSQALPYGPAPLYPVAASTETPYIISSISTDYPDTCLGYTLEDVIVRREPVENDDGIYLPPAEKPELSVQLGCWRGGEFVAFTTVTIAAGDDEVRIFPKWPVFKNSPLVYASASPVQVYAIPFKTCVTLEGFTKINHAPRDGNSLWHQSYDYPIAATFYTDIEAWINSIPSV